jgi:putative transposase
MPQSLANILLHIVFSTKHRAAWLQNPKLRQDLHAYMASIFQACDSPALIINGTADHLHALCVLSRKWSVSNLVQEIKTQPSKWLKTQGPGFDDFHWQQGYGVFSVSLSLKAKVYQYIEHQEEHHRKMTFQEEYRMLCKKHGVPLDEQYVWD